MAGNPGTYILLTRALAQSERYASELRNVVGNEVGILISPLLEITPIEGPVDLTGISWLLFTSANGVAEFARREARRDIPCLCVGKKSASAARGAGFKVTSANGSASDLVVLALDKAGQGQCLYVRGRHAAFPLVETLVMQGCETREVVVYDQSAMPLTKAALALLDGASPTLAPLFSPRTASVFMQQAADFDLSAVTAICISQKVADRLDVSRFESVRVASHPTAQALTREIAAII